MLKKRTLALLMIAVMVILSACGGRKKTEEGRITYSVYFLNKEETQVTPREESIPEGNTNVMLGSLIEIMQTKQEDVRWHAPLDYDFSVLSVSVDGGQVIINLDDRYSVMKATTAVLIRAAIVRTLTQVEGITCVSFQINGEQLTDLNGNPVGVLTPDMYVDNAGDEINSYETASLTLYFANEAGDMLKAESRDVEYNSNIALERIVVEQLIAGPKQEGLYPTINPGTEIVSIAVKDGICYVNLDQDFLTQPYNVISDATIYSITNSLVGLGSINKVQILIDGQTDVLYREKVSLNTVFERNLEMIER